MNEDRLSTDGTLTEKSGHLQKDEDNCKETSVKEDDDSKDLKNENSDKSNDDLKSGEIDGLSRIESLTNVTEKDSCEDSDISVRASGEGNECGDQNNGNSKKWGDFDKSCVVYEGEKCIYVDPNTKCRYVWDPNKSEWVDEFQSQQQCHSGKDDDYHFDGTTYMYTDKSTNVVYKWDTEKNEWKATGDTTLSVDKSKEVSANDVADKEAESTDEKIPGGPTPTPTTTFSSGGTYGYENDTHTYTDPVDNTVYIWDREKNAWFPKVDDDFMAQYQMNYGFVDPNEAAGENKKEGVNNSVDMDDKLKDAKAEKRKAQPSEPSWFEVDDEKNTKVYVSNLPLDIKEKEFVDLMQKCGLVMKDLDTGKMKVKLYAEPGMKDQMKGDGLCTYIRKESVDLALNLLDGYDCRGHKLHVERARFTMKGGTYDPSLKPKKRKKKDLEKMKKIQEKLFDWRPDKLRGERSRNESVVIVKNLFEPVIFDKDVKLILEYQQDLRDECQKLGAVKRVIIYDRHPQGVAQINFKEPEAADACVQLLNGRWFNKRRITAETWDGKTKYKIVETEDELKKRLEKWDSYLTSEEEKAAEVKRQAERESDEREKVISKDVERIKTTATDVEGSTNVEERDESDDETRSSVGSDYATDEDLDMKET